MTEWVKSSHLGAVMLCLSLINIACAVMPYWIHITDFSDIGVFTSLRSEDNRFVTTQCDSTMSEIECGYLKAMQISTVVTILFGVFSACIYFAPPRSFNNLQSFLAQVGSTAYFVFSLINTVLLRYFKVDYFTDDGINRENDTIGEDDVSYMFCYWMWVATTVASFLILTTGYAYIYQNRYNKSLV